MSLASFHYVFRVARRTDGRTRRRGRRERGARARARAARRRSRPGSSCATSCGRACRRYFDGVRADPDREKAMFELTQWALREPGFEQLARRQYDRYYELAAHVGARRRRGSPDAGGRVPVDEIARALRGRSPTASPSPGWSPATTLRRAPPWTSPRTRSPPSRSHIPFPPHPTRQQETDDRDDLTPAVFAEPTRRVHRALDRLLRRRLAGRLDGAARPHPEAAARPGRRRSCTPTYWVDNVVAFGIISGISGVCAIVAYPLTGALSDRTTSRFGRRRPWIAVGARRLRPLARPARAADDASSGSASSGRSR